MTVYNQFGGKIGLLEALFDDLAVRGRIHQVADALQKDEPLDALNNFITAFGHFWTADRMLIKRLHAMTTLDSEMAKAHAVRQKGRREGLRVIVERLHEKYKLADDFQLSEVIEILHTLTGFETFDALAGTTRSPEDVVSTVRKLILEVMGLDDIKGKENVT
jgi:AcrR family transcriptional regulator